jgi:adenylate cyclase
MKKYFLYFLTAFSVLTLVLFLQIKKIEPFESFSLRFNDINFELQKKKINENIVFLAIDEQSVNRYGRWPWNREILAEGISFLGEADTLLFDMIFSEPTNSTSDNNLANSIENLNASVCGFFLREKSTQVITEEETQIVEDSALDLLQSEIATFHNPSFVSAPYAEINIVPILESCTLSGSFSTLPESDGLMRSYPIALYYDNLLYPSLAVQGLRISLNSDIKRVSKNSVLINNKEIVLNENGFVKLNYYDIDQYKIISFLDLLDGKVSPSFFKNKIVILGIEEVGSGDIVSTPKGMMNGPLLHYTFLSNFLENHLIVEYTEVSLFLIIIMTLLPLLLILFIKEIKSRIIINILVYILLTILIRYLFVVDMIYIDLFYPLISLFLSAIIIEAIAFREQEKNSRFLKEAFSAYLSENLLDQLIHRDEPLQLGGESKELSVLFSDIRGFTELSESMPNAIELVTLINRYFTPMTHSIVQHQGMLDKYIGDAVMAFFNAPVNVIDHADQACLTALDMMQRLKLLNNELLNEGKNPINIGIGINTDKVVVGNIGSEDRFNYTVMGDGVNLSSRVEGLTKNYAVSILITEFTVAKLTQEFIYRKIEPVVVKGKEQAVLIYELMPSTEHSKTIKIEYEKALAFYIDSNFKKAKELFTLLKEHYDDGPSQYFLQNIEKNRPWDVCKMTSK